MEYFVIIVQSSSRWNTLIATAASNLVFSWVFGSANSVTRPDRRNAKMVYWYFIVALGLLLMEPLLNQRGIFDFYKQYVNYTSRSIWNVTFSMHSAMNGSGSCGPRSWDTAVLPWGHRSYGVVAIRLYHYAKFSLWYSDSIVDFLIVHFKNIKWTTKTCEPKTLLTVILL